MMIAAFYKAAPRRLSHLHNHLIRWFEGGPYSHVELIFSGGISASSSLQDGGVRFAWIDFNPERWDFIELHGFDEAAALAWFKSREGARYDLWGQARFLLGFVTPARSRYWCSEAIAAALRLDKPDKYGVNPLAAVLRQTQAA